MLTTWGVCIYIYEFVCECICMYMCVCIWEQEHLQPPASRSHAHWGLCALARACVYVYMCVHIYMCVRMYTDIYFYTVHVHILPPSMSWSSGCRPSVPGACPRPRRGAVPPAEPQGCSAPSWEGKLCFHSHSVTTLQEHNSHFPLQHGGCQGRTPTPWDRSPQHRGPLLT